MKLFKKILIGCAISVILSIFVNSQFVSNNHFEIITINSVLIGFLFTTLTIMIDLLNEKTVSEYDRSGALDKVYLFIEEGINYCVLSVFISILNLLTENIYSKLWIKNFMYTLEIIFLAISVLKLLYILSAIKSIISGTRQYHNNKKRKEKAIKELEQNLNEYD